MSDDKRWLGPQIRLLLAGLFPDPEAEAETLRFIRAEAETLRFIRPQFVGRDDGGNPSFDFDGFFQRAADLSVSEEGLAQMRCEYSDLIVAAVKCDEVTLDHELAKSKAGFEVVEVLSREPDLARRRVLLQRLLLSEAFTAASGLLWPDAPFDLSDEWLGYFAVTLAQRATTLTKTKMQGAGKEGPRKWTN
jgi:hypothetical protein